MYEITRAERLSQARVNFVTSSASLFTDQRMSGLPILAKYKYFKTLCEHTLDNSPTVSSSLFLKWLSSKQLRLCAVAQSLCWPLRNIFPRTFSYDLPHRTTTRLFLREVSPSQVILSVAPAEIRDSTIFLYSSITFSFDSHSR